MSTPEPTPLAQRLIHKASLALIPHTPGDDVTRPAARAAVVAVLRELADGYFESLLSGVRPSTVAMRPTVVPDSIRALADSIEKGAK